jgi:uncharacterized protein
MNEVVSAMLIDLGRVEDRSTFSFESSFDLPSPEGGEATCSAAVTADVARSGSRFDVKVRAQGEVRAQCHRCLEPFVLGVQVAFELVLHRGGRSPLPERGEEEDFVTISVVGEALYDIFPRVREALILEIPIKLLCREDCRGVCRKCGANLNDAECACGPEPGDPRWGVLRKPLNGESKT